MIMPWQQLNPRGLQLGKLLHLRDAQVAYPNNIRRSIYMNLLFTIYDVKMNLEGLEEYFFLMKIVICNRIAIDK